LHNYLHCAANPPKVVGQKVSHLWEVKMFCTGKGFARDPYWRYKCFDLMNPWLQVGLDDNWRLVAWEADVTAT
jgi:hypothetical protein